MLTALEEVTVAGPATLTVDDAPVSEIGPSLTIVTVRALIVIPAGVIMICVGPHINVIITFDAMVTPGGIPTADIVMSGVVMVIAGGTSRKPIWLPSGVRMARSWISGDGYGGGCTAFQSDPMTYGALTSPCSKA